jgi:histidinol-phosphate aminotransferase
MPYNLSVISTAVARELLRRPALVAERARFVIAERDRMAAALAAIPQLRVERSLANFVVFEHRTEMAATLATGLARRGVLVRDLTGYTGCERCLRASVGTVEANDALLQAVREIA